MAVVLYNIYFYNNKDSQDSIQFKTSAARNSDNPEPIDGDNPAPTAEYCVSHADNWTIPPGKAFKEWNIARDGTGDSLNPGDNILKHGFDEGHRTWYAIWKNESLSQVLLPNNVTYDIKDASAVESVTESARTVTVTKRDGTSTTFSTAYDDASTSASGLMSATDKTKLNGIDASADENVIESIEVNGTAQSVTNKTVNITVPTAVSSLTNDSGYQTSTQVSSTIAASTSKKTSSIPFAQVDSTSTATEFTATVDGITELSDGVCVYLRNGVVTSAAGFTININNLGAKPVYSSMAAATAITTVFSVNYTMLFIYNSTRVEGGCWDLFYGYYSDQNTIAYQVRANHAVGVLANTLYRYQIIFTKKDGTLLPANEVSNSTATTKALTTDAFDPFAPIYYYSTTTAVVEGGSPGASYIWTLFSGLNLRYAFNAGTTLTAQQPVYVKCSPQSDGTVKLSGKTCIVQTLPTTADGYVYLMLGIASSTSALILTYTHPIYYYANGSIRLWTNPDSVPVAATAAPLMDGTAAVGSSAKYAKEDHVHPSDTSKQDTLVSGTNIKTINNESILGSGNIEISGGGGSGGSGGGEWVSLGSSFFPTNTLTTRNTNTISATINSTNASFLKFEFNVDPYSWNQDISKVAFRGLVECSFPENNSYAYMTVPIMVTYNNDNPNEIVHGNLILKLERSNNTLTLGFDNADKSNVTMYNVDSSSSDKIPKLSHIGSPFQNQMITTYVTVLNTYAYYPSLTSATGVSF